MTPSDFSICLFPIIPRLKAFYSFTSGRHELCLMALDPTQDQVDEVSKGKAEFALFIQAELLVFLCKFGDQPWLCAPFQWHRTKAEEKSLPDIWNSVSLQVSLLDAYLDTTCALRNITLSPEFSSSLCGSILLQASTHFGGEESYQHALEELFKKHPTAESLLPLTTARTMSDGLP